MEKKKASYRRILGRLARGDAAAFRELFDLFSPKVYGFSLTLTRSVPEAEELVQDVFLKVWLHRSSLRSIDNFEAYLHTVTRNAAFNFLKRQAIERKAKSAFARQLVLEDSATEQAVIERDYEEMLQGAIQKLSPQQRLVYSLCHIEGLKYEEVAVKLRISKLTVKTHMQQALRSIKSQLRHLAATCWVTLCGYLYF